MVVCRKDLGKIKFPREGHTTWIYAYAYAHAHARSCSLVGIKPNRIETIEKLFPHEILFEKFYVLNILFFS